MISLDTSAIIVCGGKSSRMNGVNKILMPLGNTIVIGKCMLAFEKCSSIKEIIIVCQDKYREIIRSEAQKLNISKLSGFAAGGETRQQSVINGLKKISGTTELIAVHDGARPLVKPQHIEKTIKDASVFGGAVLGVPVKDTIKVVSDSIVIDTPCRSTLYITQTPQVFKKKIYFEGVDFALEHDLDFTDDCQLAEAVGTKIYMTSGDYTNIKITTPEDIKIAALLLEEQK